jgi:Domain of unknown function (DUF4438)
MLWLIGRRIAAFWCTPVRLPFLCGFPETREVSDYLLPRHRWVRGWPVRLADRVLDDPEPRRGDDRWPCTKKTCTVGSGLGRYNFYLGDCDIQLLDQRMVRRFRLDRLRFGDLAAIADADHRFGRSFRTGAMTVGVVIHSDSTVSGHGPGVTPCLPARRTTSCRCTSRAPISPRPLVSAGWPRRGRTCRSRRRIGPGAWARPGYERIVDEFPGLIAATRRIGRKQLMKTEFGLDRIVRQEAARSDLHFRPVRAIRQLDDEVDEAIEAFLQMEAEVAACSSPDPPDLPRTKVRVGATGRTVCFDRTVSCVGWSGWRGAYSYPQFAQILQRLLDPQIFRQNCMVYRYRFAGVPLPKAGYIGSARHNKRTLRDRLEEEITIPNPVRPPGPGRAKPTQGLVVGEIIQRLQTSDGRKKFRLDIGAIVAPGTRTADTTFILEKILQNIEKPKGNPAGIRTFEDFEDFEDSL